MTGWPLNISKSLNLPCLLGTGSGGNKIESNLLRVCLLRGDKLYLEADALYFLAEETTLRRDKALLLLDSGMLSTLVQRVPKWEDWS